MLVLKIIEMVNICQFDHQLIPFDTGLSAVCGRNGAGKSTLLRALAYGLTGMVDGSWGTQKDLQKDGAVSPGYVEVTLAGTDGTTVVVRRYAASTTSKSMPDKLVITKPDGTTEEVLRRSAVDNRLASMYGIPCRLLFQVFWLRQSQIDMLLTAPAAIVNAFLQDVFDMRNLETVRDKLKGAIDTIATGLQGTEDEIKSMEQELSELADDDYIDSGLKYVEEQLAESNKEREDFIKKYGDLSDLDKVEKRCGVLRTDRLKYNKMLQDAEHVLESFGEPPPAPETTSSRQEMLDGIAHADEKIRRERQNQYTLEAALKTSEDSIKNWKARVENVHQKVKCPDKCELCGGDIQDQDAYVSRQCKMLTGCESLALFDEKANAEIEYLEKEIERDHNALVESHENMKLLENSMHLLQTEVKRLDDCKLYREKLTIKATCEEMLAKINPELKKLEHLLDKSDEIREAKRNLDEASAQLHETADKVKAEAARIRERRRILTGDLEKARKRLEQEKVNKEARRILKELRDGLSANRVQARYLASKIAEINRGLEHFMQFTGMPFSLYLREDTHTFAFSTPDGFEHPTMHLSGAQKNMSAVALQMALFNVINPQINLFLIDEPSEALDDGNKVVMAEMFRRMNNMLNAMHGTMLIVSRDEKMVESCETIITVGAQ